MTPGQHHGSSQQQTSAVLIVNPSAGGGRFLADGQPSAALRQVQELLSQAGFKLSTRVTGSAEEATEVAAQADDQGHRVAFALGGDGTFRDVARGLLGSPTALGLLGGGTTNVLPYSLGLPRRAEAMARSLAGDGGWHTSSFDVGRLHCASGTEHLFLMMVSRGLDSRALARTPPERKRTFGRLGIAYTGMTEWLRSADPSFELEVEGQTFRTAFAAIHNIEHYGGTFRMAPGARSDDRQLSVVGFRQRGRGAIARFALGVLVSSHLKNPQVFQLAAAEARFGGRGAAEIQMDGDPLMIELPASISLYPESLILLRPGTPDAPGH